jgi:uncharacterized protein involved in exopolysaccharide biosynthesis
MMTFRTSCAALLITAFVTSASAQDVRGMEACMAEKAMERRTGCLQANVEFLQQELAKLKREMQAQLAAARTEAKAQSDSLKAALAKLEAELAQMKAKTEPKVEKK